MIPDGSLRMIAYRSRHFADIKDAGELNIRMRWCARPFAIRDTLYGTSGPTAAKCG